MSDRDAKVGKYTIHGCYGDVPLILIRPYFFLVPLPLEDLVPGAFFPKCTEWDGNIYQAISSCEHVAVKIVPL